MKIIDPFVLIPPKDPKLEAKLDRYARVCYKSEDKINDKLAALKGCVRSGHHSILEHEKVTVLFTVDRGIQQQITRHRAAAAYSIESTIYCNYWRDKFGSQIVVIEPFYFKSNGRPMQLWRDACESAEDAYLTLIAEGASTDEARAVLPLSLKSEMVVTYNMREWRHFFSLRAEHHAHPQMRQVAIPLLLKLKDFYPIVFGDIPYDKHFPSEHYARIHTSDDMLLDYGIQE